MPIIEEYDHLMAAEPASVFTRYQDNAALTDRIYEWLETPAGTMADNPSWGHNLGQFKHEPLSENLNVMVEMSIQDKMPRDIDNLAIGGVSCDFQEIDLCKIIIDHQLGRYEVEIGLA